MNSPRDKLSIAIPEGIVFHLPLAGLLSRALALLLDMLLVGAILMTISVPVFGLGWISTELVEAFLVLLYFLIPVGYGVVFEKWWNGQTPGKKVFRIRVVDARGLSLKPTQIIMRNLFRVVDMLPALYLVGGVASFVSPLGQRLGDLAAGTVVIRKRTTSGGLLPSTLAVKYNSLRSHPHLVARLRQNMSPDESRLGLEALVRRDQLHETDKINLFAEIAAFYKTKVKFPTEAVEGLSDEKYVQNVIDVLYRR